MQRLLIKHRLDASNPQVPRLNDTHWDDSQPASAPDGAPQDGALVTWHAGATDFLGLRMLTGTANQIVVSVQDEAIILSLPQDIAPTTSPVFAGLTLGNGIGSSLLFLNGAAGSPRAILGQSAAVNRWIMYLGNATVESGGNAGSDFQLFAIDDAQAGIDSPVIIYRASGGPIALGGTTNRPVALTGSLRFDAPTTGINITVNTTDGADNGILQIGASGALGTSRGAYMNLFGNEHVTSPGDFQLFPGIGGSLEIYNDAGGGVARQLLVDQGVVVGDGVVSGKGFLTVQKGLLFSENDKSLMMAIASGTLHEVLKITPTDNLQIGFGTFNNVLIGPTAQQLLINTTGIVLSGTLKANAAGPHAFGQVANAQYRIISGGTFAATATHTYGVGIAGTLQPSPTGAAAGLVITVAMQESSSGLSPYMAGIVVVPSIIANAGATLTNADSIQVGPLVAPSGTTNASAIRITGAPSGATNNYALWIVNGSVRIGGVGPHAIGGATDPAYQLLLTGTYNGGATSQDGFKLKPTIVIGANNGAAILSTEGTLQRASSGTHPNFSGVTISSPTITGSGATITNAQTLLLSGVPTAGQTNLALRVMNGGFAFEDVAPCAIGGNISATNQLYLRGTFVGGAFGLNIETRLQPAGAAGNPALGIIAGTIDKDAAYTTASALLLFPPTLTAGAGSVATAATLRITDGPTGATDNYALWSDAGLNRFDGDGTHILELPADATDPTGGGGAAVGRIPVKIGGATKYLAYY